METMIIQAGNEAELNLIRSFLETHKLKGRVLNDDDKEDLVLGRLMEETDYNGTVEASEFLKKLRG